ncbi:hypothetical protein llap_13237 [Limosa lapponica baueri]|uniref:G-protein coupled receptors family 1 profile domain-containing protein n=1 Tax=Limosa lapponica baueri TaxID=1758121 RepID=A0A2I0TRV0_LIMLA|nr:hypothetical protein llap_13237 [Limosa lapponica baueri]
MMMVVLPSLALALLCLLRAGAEVPVQPGFDAEKFAGTWHVVAIASNCSMFLKMKDGMKSSITTISFTPEGDVAMKLLWPMADKCQKFELLFQRSGQAGHYMERSNKTAQVVDTDGKTYAVIFASRLKDGKTLHMLRLYSRTQEGSPKITALFKKLAREKSFTDEMIKMLPRQGQTCPGDKFLLLVLLKKGIYTMLQLHVSLVYLVTVMGNLLIMILSWLDAHLQSPVYFFWGHLSFLDICYSSVTVPKILGDSFSPQRTISFVGCITQIYFFLCFGGSECMLLAYNRYLAICHPLHYPALMSKKMCHCLVVILWLSGSFSSLIQAFLTAHLPFCSSNTIDHLFCEMPFLLKLSCSPNTPLNKAASYALAGTIAVGSLLLTLVSYVHIIRTVLQRGAGTQRAFATCTSHLTVVSLFFGAGAVAYLVPHSSGSTEMDEVLALLYAVVTPTLNPIIYSLRNSEIKGPSGKPCMGDVQGGDVALGDPTHEGSGAPGRVVLCGAGGGTGSGSLLSLTNASNAQTRYCPMGTWELGTHFTTSSPFVSGSLSHSWLELALPASGSPSHAGTIPASDKSWSEEDER